MTEEKAEISNSEDSFDHERRYMVSNLVRLLRYRICWADKVDIVDAINGIEMDYEDWQREKRHLFDNENTPQQG